MTRGSDRAAHSRRVRTEELADPDLRTPRTQRERRAWHVSKQLRGTGSDRCCRNTRPTGCAAVSCATADRGPRGGAAGTANDRADRVRDRKSTRLNSSHEWISYAVFCLKKKKAVAHDTPLVDCQGQHVNSL